MATKKNKEELRQELERSQKVQRQRTLARLIFPSVEQLETIYDAQTAFQSASGFIKYGLLQKETALKVSDLKIDATATKDSLVTFAVQNILELVKDEPAVEVMQLIEMMGSKLPGYLAQKHIKDPMSSISVKDYIAE